MTKEEAIKLADDNQHLIGTRIKGTEDVMEPVLQIFGVKPQLVGLDNWDTVLVFPYGVKMIDGGEHLPISIYELIGESPTYTVFK